MKFKLVYDFKPTGDQPQAIAELVENLNKNVRNQVLLGVTGSGKTFTMAQVIAAVQKPNWAGRAILRFRKKTWASPFRFAQDLWAVKEFFLAGAEKNLWAPVRNWSEYQKWADRAARGAGFDCRGNCWVAPTVSSRAWPGIQILDSGFRRNDKNLLLIVKTALSGDFYLFNIFINRDFLRAAVFFLITPRLAALSMAW